MLVPWTTERECEAGARPSRRWPRVAAAALLASALTLVVASAPASAAVPVPTKALCKKDSYKIGYDVFSGTQPFANLVSKGLKDAAKKTRAA